MFVFHPIATRTREQLLTAGLDPDDIADLVRRTVREDLLGGTDVTSAATVPASQVSRATFTSRSPGVVAGLAVAASVVDTICGDAASDVQLLVADGDRIAAGQDLAQVEAPTRGLLTAERSALNVLCHLSGVATLTRRWVDAVAGTAAAVRDTRKTMPGLRALEKYAVRCGGGVNHRMGLSDMALVKDNHVVAAGGITEACRQIRTLAGELPVQVEVDSLDQLVEAIEADADEILLDNFSADDLRVAVAIRDDKGPQVNLEASGGLTLERARIVAETGVDTIAVGELTHSARILDIGLDLQAID